MITHFSGAGIIIIVHYNSDYNFLLFKNKFTHRLMDLGGTTDNNERPYVTASREAREESKDLFSVSSSVTKKLQFVDIDSGSGVYRCYVLFIDGFINDEFYYKNSRIIEHSNLSPCWKETIDMIKIPLDISHKIYEQIHPRTQKILKKLLTTKLTHLIKVPKVTTKKSGISTYKFT